MNILTIRHQGSQNRAEFHLAAPGAGQVFLTLNLAGSGLIDSQHQWFFLYQTIHVLIIFLLSGPIHANKFEHLSTNNFYPCGGQLSAKLTSWNHPKTLPQKTTQKTSKEHQRSPQFAHPWRYLLLLRPLQQLQGICPISQAPQGAANAAVADHTGPWTFGFHHLPLRSNPGDCQGPQTAKNEMMRRPYRCFLFFCWLYFQMAIQIGFAINLFAKTNHWTALRIKNSGAIPNSLKASAVLP